MELLAATDGLLNESVAATRIKTRKLLKNNTCITPFDDSRASFVPAVGGFRRNFFHFLQAFY